MLNAQVQESEQGLNNFNSDLCDWLIFSKIKKRFQKTNRSKEFCYSSGGTRRHLKTKLSQSNLFIVKKF